jgi:hypothetical protein
MARSSGEATTLSIVYSGFGKTVNVTAPPADQVGDVTGFRGLLGGH